MTPIAEKDFGTDQESGLNKKLQVLTLFIDAEQELISIGFRIVLFGPTGIVVSILRRGSYVRTGSKFQDLRNSQLGAGITGLIAQDLAGINSFESLDEDLKQE